MTHRVIFTFLFFVLLFEPKVFSHDRLVPEIDVFTLKTEHFRIHHTLSYEPFARKLAGYLEEALPVLSQDLQWQPEGKIEVVIRPDRDLANAFAQTFPQNLITVHPLSYSSLGSLEEDENWVRLLAYHELTHIIANDSTSGIFKFFRTFFGSSAKVNQYQPTWMIEGLAVYEETKNSTSGRGRAVFSDMVLRSAASEGRLNSKDLRYGISLDRLSDGAPVWPDSLVPYLFGYVMYEKLAEEMGSSAPGDMSIGSSWRIPLFVEGNIHNVVGNPSLSFWNRTVDRLVQIANEELALIRSQEVTSFDRITHIGRASAGLTLSSDQKRAYFIRDSYREGVGISEVDLVSHETKNLTLAPMPMGTTLHVATGGLVYSKIDQHQEFNQFSDIYYLDLNTQKEHQLTAGMRAFDPDVSSDFQAREGSLVSGQVVFVKNTSDGNQSLVVWDGKTERVLYVGKNFEKISRPAWGRGVAKDWIVFGSKPIQQNEDLYLIQVSTKQLKKITFNEKNKKWVQAITPSWSQRGDLIFSSSKSGIYNVYELKWEDVEKKAEPKRLTHFETGAFYPQSLVDGRHLAMIYGPEGFDVGVYQPKLRKQKPVELGTLKERLNLKKENQSSSKVAENISIKIEKEDYSPFPSLWPQYVLPFGQVLQDGWLLGARTSANDSLSRHGFGALGAWDTRASFPIYQFDYQYDGFYPSLHLVNKQANQYIQRQLSSNRDNSWDLFFHYPIGDYSVEFGGNWTRSEFQGQSAGSGGLKVSFGYGSSVRFPDSIERNLGETGRWCRLTLGGYFVGDEQYSTVEASYEKRFPVFWPRHFLRVNLSGAKSTNQNIATAYHIGGSTGFIADYATYQVRGYPSGVILGRDIAVANIEYWFPLFDLFHGVGVIPFFYDRAKVRVFVDTGSGEFINGNLDRFATWPVATGVHLMQDIKVLFKYPITLAFGFDWGLQSALGGQRQFVVGAFGKFPFF